MLTRMLTQLAAHRGWLGMSPVQTPPFGIAAASFSSLSLLQPTSQLTVQLSMPPLVPLANGALQSSFPLDQLETAQPPQGSTQHGALQSSFPLDQPPQGSAQLDGPPLLLAAPPALALPTPQLMLQLDSSAQP